jgi:hypothetical protein
VAIQVDLCQLLLAAAAFAHSHTTTLKRFMYLVGGHVQVDVCQLQHAAAAALHVSVS